MAADRQHVILRPENAGTWRAQSSVGAGDTCAWMVRLDEFGPRPLSPSASDLADVGVRSGKARDRFLARRSALRRLVGRRLAVDAEEVIIGYDQKGAPRLLAPPSDHFVSVAGRGVWAGFGLAPRPIGIDLELLEPEGAIPWAMLNPSERERIQLLRADLRAGAFLRHWTAKEAYLKRLGTGLFRDPAEIGVCWKKASRFSILDKGRPVAGEGTGIVCGIDKPALVAAWFVAGDPGERHSGDEPA